jgi:hypothetical protein
VLDSLALSRLFYPWREKTLIVPDTSRPKHLVPNLFSPSCNQQKQFGARRRRIATAGGPQGRGQGGPRQFLQEDVMRARRALVS